MGRGRCAAAHAGIGRRRVHGVRVAGTIDSPQRRRRGRRAPLRPLCGEIKMPRDLIIGNGSLVVAFDAQYRLADLYFPHVGQENHAGAPSRFGVWADGAMSWVESDAWQRTLAYLRETLVTDVTCTNEQLGLRLRCYDTVDADANLYVRKIVVRNLREESRTIKLYFHHDFNLYGNASSDTTYFDPDPRAI